MKHRTSNTRLVRLPECAGARMCVLCVILFIYSVMLQVYPNLILNFLYIVNFFVSQKQRSGRLKTKTRWLEGENMPRGALKWVSPCIVLARRRANVIKWDTKILLQNTFKDIKIEKSRLPFVVNDLFFTKRPRQFLVDLKDMKAKCYKC